MGLILYPTPLFQTGVMWAGEGDHWDYCYYHDSLSKRLLSVRGRRSECEASLSGLFSHLLEVLICLKTVLCTKLKSLLNGCCTDKNRVMPETNYRLFLELDRISFHL